jgi:signal transduction histidine kinase
MLLDGSQHLDWIYDLYQFGQSETLEERSSLVFGQMLSHIVTGFNADTGSLVLYQGDGTSRLCIVAAIGLPETCIGSEIPTGNGVIGWVLANQQALLLKGDVGDDQRFQGRIAKSDSQMPVASLCWPLIIGSRVLGALCINSFDDKVSYTGADLDSGQKIVNLITLVIDNIRLHVDQQQRIQQLAASNERYLDANRQLQNALDTIQEVQRQLIQSEKMSSIGQLAAGVAHEINNPIGYINSNLSSLKTYVEDLLALVARYEALESSCGDAEQRSQLLAFKQKIDLAFLKVDVLDLVKESQDGAFRVRKIVQDLKDFSYAGGGGEWQWANLNECLDSTLNIVKNEVKYKATVVKEYQDIPLAWCLPHQLNQVLMNLLVNAAHAIEENGVITIRTGVENDNIWIEVSDTGKGMEPEILDKIFDPFFTTKPVGKGTGLGLSVSYSIIKKHRGEIQVNSKVGMGSTFRVVLPPKC